MGLKHRVSRLESTIADAGKGCVRCAGDSELKVWMACAGEPQPPVRTCARCGREITMLIILRSIIDGKGRGAHADE